jgi:hypothetical protein
MSQTVILQLSDESVDRYRRGATAARKPLEEFLIERLKESVPPSVAQLPSPLEEELQQMESLDDDTLWKLARATLPAALQRRYDRLLGKNARSPLTEREQETLRTIGEDARRLTLMKAHAYQILKWRGHDLPSVRGLPIGG